MVCLLQNLEYIFILVADKHHVHQRASWLVEECSLQLLIDDHWFQSGDIPAEQGQACLWRLSFLTFVLEMHIEKVLSMLVTLN